MTAEMLQNSSVYGDGDTEIKLAKNFMGKIVFSSWVLKPPGYAALKRAS